MGIKCLKCHSENTDTQRFCGECGTPLSTSKDISIFQTKTLETPVCKLTKGSRFPDNLDILIISAKYGMINSEKMIENYDQKMNYSRARGLRESVIKKLKYILSESRYENILINLGSVYMEVLSGFEKIIPDSAKVSILIGKTGERKRNLRSWILSIK